MSSTGCRGAGRERAEVEQQDDRTESRTGGRGASGLNPRKRPENTG